jgi:hypothetical protein
MAVAAIINEEANKCADCVDFRSIDDRAPVARAPYQPRACKNAEVRRERVMRATNFLCDSPCAKTARFGTHQKLKDCEPRGLTQGRERCERVRRGHPVPSGGGTDVTHNG